MGLKLKKLQDTNFNFIINLMNLFLFLFVSIGVIILRSYNIISLSWWIILLPILIPVLISFLVLIIISVILMIGILKDPNTFKYDLDSLEKTEDVKKED
jgi:putative effector of murein hydrolase LrgA (UPF0299 family)